MNWTELAFGKYAGKTLPQVMFLDPDWFFWAYENAVFQGKGTIEREAEDIYRKATRIKIPEKFGQDQQVEYTIHPSANKFSKVDVVPESQPRHEGSSPTFRQPYFDMSAPRQLAAYDKTGGALLIKDIKFYVFGNSKSRITKGRAEAFFNDHTNFHI